jgi:hypothetical protein
MGLQQADLLGGELGASAGEKVTDVGAVVQAAFHALTVRPGTAGRGVGLVPP